MFPIFLSLIFSVRLYLKAEDVLYKYPKVAL